MVLPNSITIIIQVLGKNVKKYFKEVTKIQAQKNPPKRVKVLTAISNKCGGPNLASIHEPSIAIIPRLANLHASEYRTLEGNACSHYFNCSYAG